MNQMQGAQRDSKSKPELPIEFPVFAGRVVVFGRRAICYTQDREIRVEAPGRLLAELVRLCDGHTSSVEIVAELGLAWSHDNLTSLIDALAAQGALCEAGRLVEHWWTFNKKPAEDLRPQYPTNTLLPGAVGGGGRQVCVAGGLAGLLKRRGITKTFGAAPIPHSILLSIFWASYGISDFRTVPSAGDVYPLEVHWINLRATDDLNTGVYRLDFPGSHEVRVGLIDTEITLAPLAFVDCDLFHEAQGILVVSGNLGLATSRHGTRAALHVPLEAGHVAQNVHLAAIENSIAAVQVGSFRERQLSSLLKLADGVAPLTAVFLGNPSSAEDLAIEENASGIEYRWLETERLTYSPPFFTCSARINEGVGDWAWGRSTDPAMAHIKASAEAQERWSCTRPSGLRKVCFQGLENAVDPRAIIAYSFQQYAQQDFSYRPFDPNYAYSWKEGIEIKSGQAKSVLADFVYFGDCLDRSRPYTDASSSGTAAYTTEQGAVERAVLELIERDAFMRTWCSRATRPTIELASFPEALSKRVRRLREAGVEIVFKDCSLDLTPVVLAFAQSSRKSFTIVTASSAFDAEEALDSALMELELGVTTRLEARNVKVIEPTEVYVPVDHNNLYAQRRYYRRADFLAGEGPQVGLSELGAAHARDWSELCARLDKRGQSVIWFNLTPSGAGLYVGRVPLVIGRAIVPGLIPISFGYGQEPLALFERQSVVYWLRPRPGSSSTAPSMFPHPFG